jgi:dTDP-4-dehydrorhamnose reductase
LPDYTEPDYIEPDDTEPDPSKSDSGLLIPGLHLVVGASGQVGGALLIELERRNLECLGTYHKTLPPDASLLQLDLGRPEDIMALVGRLKPSHIYVPASYTNVDGCEENPDLSYAINVQGVKSIAQAAKMFGAKLIYFSSDYVFDGIAGPYSEDDPVSPVSVYGRHKVMAEEIAVSETKGAAGASASGASTGGASTALIIRTTVVFGNEWQKKNFVLRLIRSLSEGTEVPIPEDQIGTPTLNSSLAHTTLELVLKSETGVFNVAGAELCSRYDLARAVAAEFGLDEGLLVPVKTSMLNQKAKRPLRAGLKVDKVRALLGQNAQLTGFREALRQLHKELDID